MRLLQATLIGVSSLSAAVTSSQIEVNNYCTESLWLVDANQTVQTPAAFELPSGTAYLKTISGSGNVMGVSKGSDYYSDQTPKLIVGTTTYEGTLWWTVSDLNGDAFPGGNFNVTSSKDEICGSQADYDEITHNCPDGDFTLAVNPCFED